MRPTRQIVEIDTGPGLSLTRKQMATARAARRRCGEFRPACARPALARPPVSGDLRARLTTVEPIDANRSVQAFLAVKPGVQIPDGESDRGLNRVVEDTASPDVVGDAHSQNP